MDDKKTPHYAAEISYLLFPELMILWYAPHPISVCAMRTSALLRRLTQSSLPCATIPTFRSFSRLNDSLGFMRSTNYSLILSKITSCLSQSWRHCRPLELSLHRCIWSRARAGGRASARAEPSVVRFLSLTAGIIDRRRRPPSLLPCALGTFY